MVKLQVVFYIVAIVLLIVAALHVPTRVSLALIAAAFALLAFALPTINAL